MIDNLRIIDKPVDNKGFIKCYQSATGSLQFLAIYIRPDIAFAAGWLTCWNHASMKQCWDAVKHLLEYLQEFINIEMIFDSIDRIQLGAYSNSDWAGDLYDWKSTTGSCIMIAGGPVLWKLIKQTGVSLSSTEAEYIAASETAKNVIIIR